MLGKLLDGSFMRSHILPLFAMIHLSALAALHFGLQHSSRSTAGFYEDEYGIQQEAFGIMFLFGIFSLLLFYRNRKDMFFYLGILPVLVYLVLSMRFAASVRSFVPVVNNWDLIVNKVLLYLSLEE